MQLSRLPTLKSDVRFEGGRMKQLSHWSESCQCEMTFSIFLPERPDRLAEDPPVLYYLSGLTWYEIRLKIDLKTLKYSKHKNQKIRNILFVHLHLYLLLRTNCLKKRFTVNTVFCSFIMLNRTLLSALTRTLVRRLTLPRKPVVLASLLSSQTRVLEVSTSKDRLIITNSFAKENYSFSSSGFGAEMYVYGLCTIFTESCTEVLSV